MIRLLRRVAIWLVALAPVVAFAYLYALHHLPLSDRLINLQGSWRLLEGGEGQDLSSPELDDSGWKEITFPGSYSGQGFKDPHSWVRRTFERPEHLRDTDLFLMIGDSRSGVGRVFVNGVEVGRTDPGARGLKSELSGVEGWDVPKALMRDGKNVVAIQYHWHFLGEDGISDPRLYLGDAGYLKPYFVKNNDARKLMQYGSVFLLGFLIVLFGALLIAEWSSPTRPLYLASLGMVASIGAYLALNVGLIPLTTDSYWYFPIVYLLVVVLAAGLVAFSARYYHGARSRFRKISLVAAALFCTAYLAAALTGESTYPRGLYDLHSLWLLVMMGYMLANSVVGALRQRRDLDPVLIAAVLVVAATGVNDLLNDTYVIQGPRLFPLGVSSAAILASVVLIADFTKLFFVNRELSSSLSKTNVELADALVKAQEASRLKSEFVANVSHELRTPLNSVINVPEGLLEYFESRTTLQCTRCDARFEKEPSDVINESTRCLSCQSAGTLVEQAQWLFKGDLGMVAKNLQQIHRAGSHLLRLINDVLDFSKLEAGKMVLNLEKVHVSAMLDDLVHTLEPVAKQRRIRIEVLRPPADLSIQVDRVKCVQVLINLVGNALKFSHEDGVVTLRAAREGEACHFWVQDRGIGIAPEHHATIFESFRQVDGSHTRKYGGTGLGLSITRKLIEAHQGKVWVESELGQGSTFHVVLPIAGPALPEDGRAPAVETVEATPAPGGKTILVLDDEPFAVENVKLALKDLGHKVVGTTQPDRLAEMLAQHSPDLLILDIMMPRISGIEVLKALRADPTRRLPVLVSSAYHSNIDLVRALGAAWVGKPWKGDELVREVRRLLSESPVPVPELGAAPMQVAKS